ncbi:MAG: peptidylprolyl isomerase [Candidatus Cloacimonetes bacterium]|nr:peptidylprolyl isomerase [Candidatus Cloacimonadota bacterium]
MKIEKNKVVSFHYVLKNNEGEVIDSSENHEPLVYIQGSGGIIAGLEEAMEGKKIGDKFDVVIPPDKAYGLYDDELLQTIPLSSFEDPADVEEGIQFQVDTGDGIRIATVTEVHDDEVIIDFNHPLSGETLYFDIDVQEIREATEEELEHGHVHTHECCH